MVSSVCSHRAVSFYFTDESEPSLVIFSYIISDKSDFVNSFRKIFSEQCVVLQ